MAGDETQFYIRNYDLWCQLSDDEYKELKVEHSVIEVPKGEYIYFEAYNHNKVYFVKEGTIKIGYIDDDGNEKVKEIIQKASCSASLVWNATTSMGSSPRPIRTMSVSAHLRSTISNGC